MAGHLIFDSGPNFVRIYKRQRGFAAPRPGAQQKAGFVVERVAGPLRVGMAAQSAAKVVLEDGPEVAPSAGAIEGIGQTQLACQLLSHHAVRDAAGAVLVLGPFFF